MAAKAHVFVDDLDAPELASEDRHHLKRVLRLRPGDTITVSDGAGGWRDCRFGGTELEVAGDVVHDAEPVPPVAVGFAVVKGERTDWAVQKLTEIGVDRIVPFLAARSVVRWEPGEQRTARHVERLRRIAREAASQSRRTRLPQIDEVRTFSEVAAEPGAVLAAPGGSVLRDQHPLVLVGPEGGWSREETAGDRPLIGLGPQILRTETAAIAAGVLLVHSRESNPRRR